VAKTVSDGTLESVVVSPVLTLWKVGALGVERRGQWIGKILYVVNLTKNGKAA
jgi:hypothetical protein